MTTHAFDIVLEGILPSNADDAADALYCSGCDDAIMATRLGVTHLGFEREAISLLKAILGAIENIESADLPSGVMIARVDLESLVTATELAALLGRSRQSIHQLANGHRGPGDFPAPAVAPGSRSFWNLPDVLDWFAKREPENREIQQQSKHHRKRALTIDAINGALALRRIGEKRASTIVRALLPWFKEPNPLTFEALRRFLQSQEQEEFARCWLAEERVFAKQAWFGRAANEPLVNYRRPVYRLTRQEQNAA